MVFDECLTNDELPAQATARNQTENQGIKGEETKKPTEEFEKFDKQSANP